jgi:uncharacterized protein YbjT (DUF2867 family)
MVNVNVEPRTPEDRLILLTGATGYIGGRLLQVLEARGEKVRCLVRHPSYIQGRIGPKTEVIRGDVFDLDGLARALEGVDTAFYLVHSMGTGKRFDKRDREAAKNFGEAARTARVRRIIYLGGLAQGTCHSSHLRSRLEVGCVLRESGVPTIEFRASIIIGSGSLSFEMVRSLVERLPIMITPTWVRSLAQPIAVEDVIQYLLEAMDLPLEGSAVFEIGGSDKVSYEGIMREYARQRKLKRIMIPVPFFSPEAASYFLALVTPLYFPVGRKLIASVKNDSVVMDHAALVFFSVKPKGLAEAISRAIGNEDRQFAVTHWSDALAENNNEHHLWGVAFGPRRVDSYSKIMEFPPEEVFLPIQRIGGENGWYAYRWLWWTKGYLDRWMGGVGMRTGRRDPYDLRVGDAIDFWRVEKLVPNRLLLLFAEMKLPGRAWTFFEISPHEKGSEVRITAVFDPKGVWGRWYWYTVSPYHYLVFTGMLKGIAKAVESNRKESMAELREIGD